MSKYKLSIIVPVYNVERYLEECIDSILMQEHEGCQIILVDDGSTDGSGVICDKYAKEYDIVSVYHRENAGPSAARNYGIGRAEGEYICFVDSDDRISQGAVPEILAWIEHGGTDLCFMDAIKFFPKGKTIPLGDGIRADCVRDKTKLFVMQHLMTRPKFPGSPCTKLYRRELLQQSGIAFPKDNRHAEDLGFVLDCILKAESYDVLTFPYYEYRQARENSRSSALVKTFWGMASFVQESVEKLTDDKKPRNEICACAMSFVAYEYSVMLWQYSRLAGGDREKAREVLECFNWVLCYGRSRKIKLIKTVIEIFGLDLTAKILNVYMTYR